MRQYLFNQSCNLLPFLLNLKEKAVRNGCPNVYTCFSSIKSLATWHLFWWTIWMYFLHIWEDMVCIASYIADCFPNFFSDIRFRNLFICRLRKEANNFLYQMKVLKVKEESWGVGDERKAKAGRFLFQQLFFLKESWLFKARKQHKIDQLWKRKFSEIGNKWFSGSICLYFKAEGGTSGLQ